MRSEADTVRDMGSSPTTFACPVVAFTWSDQDCVSLTVPLVKGEYKLPWRPKTETSIRVGVFFVPSTKRNPSDIFGTWKRTALRWLRGPDLVSGWQFPPLVRDGFVLLHPRMSNTTRSAAADARG